MSLGQNRRPDVSRRPRPTDSLHESPGAQVSSAAENPRRPDNPCRSSDVTATARSTGSGVVSRPRDTAPSNRGLDTLDSELLDRRFAGHPARWWHELDDGRLQCDLCPRGCRLRDGQNGFCFVRARAGDQIVLTTYGRSSGFALDPIEKKPLSHFYPGSTAFSFGTAGCNLGCKFCQNWSISTAHEFDRLGEQASPEQIVEAAAHIGAQSIAFTYNDPVIFAEYAIDTALAARAAGIHPVAVTAGYICFEPRAEFYAAMDAANIDLKAFTEEFYWRITGAHLRDVLDTLVYVQHETDVWLEITNLVIPGLNDSPVELKQMFDWLVRELGPDVPLHLSAFHPAYRMRDIPPTPPDTLKRARELALDAGLYYVYTGNIYDNAGQATYCPGCGKTLIKRAQYRITANRVVADGASHGHCPECGTAIAGRF